MDVTLNLRVHRLIVSQQRSRTADELVEVREISYDTDVYIK